VNTSAIGKHMKDAREHRPVTLAGFLGDTYLATDDHVMVLLSEKELVHAFARRDWWPALPEGDEAYVYAISIDEDVPKEERILVEEAPDAGDQLIERWNKWTDLRSLELTTLTPWVCLMAGVSAHVLKFGDGYLYLDTELVALITDEPFKFRWYRTDEEKAKVVIAKEAVSIAVIQSLDPNYLEVLCPPDDILQKIRDFDRQLKDDGQSATFSTVDRETGEVMESRIGARISAKDCSNCGYVLKKNEKSCHAPGKDILCPKWAPKKVEVSAV